MRSRSLLAIATLGVVVCAAAGWRTPPLSVVVITLDTTRTDRLAPYGLMDVPMPHLERLSREGTVFDQAISASPLTLPSHATLFTGLLPPRHGVRDNADRRLADAHTTLAEVLRGRGFRTAAFVASAVLDPGRGLAQGFETYSGVPPEGEGIRQMQRRGNDIAADAGAWLANVGGSRFFLWAHLYDPHVPYDAPPSAGTRSTDPYVAELEFADIQIGRVLAALESHGLLERTIVVVAGDHGESLGDHGEAEHGIFLYDTVIRVPLIVRVPRAAPGRVAEVVRLTDVMPTVLQLVGERAPPGDGVSLVDLLTGRRRGLDLEAYSESLYPQRFGWSALYALRDGRFKYIDAPRPELYDLARDPFERHNIVRERPQVAAAMKRRLAFLASSAAAPTADDEVAAPDVRERLAALGYVGSGPARVVPAATGLPDPKDCLPLTTGTPRSTRRAAGCGT